MNHRACLALAGSLVTVGCSRPAPQEAAAPPPAPESALAEVRVEPRLMAGCGAPERPAEFTVDIADIGPPETDALAWLARCLAVGPLAGREIRVTTWAAAHPPDRDVARVRGLRGYAVRDYLVFRGVARGSITMTVLDSATSGSLLRGALDERRVDISLVPGTPP